MSGGAAACSWACASLSDDFVTTGSHAALRRSDDEPLAYHPGLVGMQRRLLASLLVPLAVLALGAAACSGSGGTSSTTSASAPTIAVTDSTSIGPVGTKPGVYLYVNAGLTVHMNVRADGGTMQVINKTGRDLPKPGFYLLDARDGSQINGKVVSSAPVPNGDTKDFKVTFDKTLDVSNIGLLILTMGADNYGAFVNT